MKLLLALFSILVLTALVPAQSPAGVEKLLVQALDQAATYGSYGDSYDEAKLTAANKKIVKLLADNGKRPEILKYSFPKLGDAMRVTTSKDGKLRIYSWDMQTGGTAHDYASVIQYMGNKGRAFVWADQNSSANGGFYLQIYQIATSAGPIYLANSYFKASTSLTGQSILAFRITGDTLDLRPRVIKTSSGLTNEVGFAYDFFSVADDPKRSGELFIVDEAKKEFRFPVVIEDKETPQGRVTDKLITYRFNGKYFVKVN